MDIPIPSHIFGDPGEIQREAAARIVDQLCAVWGWLPDELEARILGEQLSVALFAAVEHTRTQPLTLLDALLAPRPGGPAPTVETIVIRESPDAALAQ